MAKGARNSGLGGDRHVQRGGPQRVASFGRPLPDEEESPLPRSLQLPAARMDVDLVLADGALAALCEAVRKGIYDAARQALADAVADFAAEQEHAAGSNNA